VKFKKSDFGGEFFEVFPGAANFSVCQSNYAIKTALNSSIYRKNTLKFSFFNFEF